MNKVVYNACFGGFGDCWWSPIEEKVIGWMNQKDLEEYLISLQA